MLKYPSRILGLKASPKYVSPVFKDLRLEPLGHRSPSGHATHVATLVPFAVLILPVAKDVLVKVMKFEDSKRLYKRLQYHIPRTSADPCTFQCTLLHVSFYSGSDA